MSMSVTDVVTDLIGSQHTRGTPLVPATRGEIRRLSSKKRTRKKTVEGRKFIIFTSFPSVHTKHILARHNGLYKIYKTTQRKSFPSG